MHHLRYSVGGFYWSAVTSEQYLLEMAPLAYHLLRRRRLNRHISGDNVYGSRKELLHNVDPLFSQRGKNRHPGSWDTRTRAALRSGDWKIITGDPGNSSWVPAPKNEVKYPHFVSIPERKDKNLWLFDLGKDPLETRDVSELYPGMVKKLLGKLAAYKNLFIMIDIDILS